jgi:hypothetical protein
LREFHKADAARRWWQKKVLPPQSPPTVNMCLLRMRRRRKLHEAEQAEIERVCGAPRSDPTGSWLTCAVWFASDPKYNKYADYYCADDGED